MSFQGDVAGIGLGELLQGLARGGREGVLTLRGGGLGATLGLQGGQIFLLPEPDEDPEIWRRRSERAWVRDPSQRIDRLRMSEIAYAARLETMFALLDCEGVHFRFEPGPLPRPSAPPTEAEPQLGRIETGGGRLEMKVPVHCQGISVEYLLLEYARLSDECRSQEGPLAASVHDVPRVLDPSVPSPAMERFWGECDGMSNLREIADRLGWPERQCRATVQELCARGYLRLADPRELLVLAQRELSQNHFSRAASRLSGWLHRAQCGPLPLGDAELLLAEWQKGKLPAVLSSMEARDTRTLLKRLESRHGDARASIARWRELRKHHRHDPIAELRLVQWQLASGDEAEAPSMAELLKLARKFQDASCRLRAGVLLRAAASRLPETTSMRLELGTRMLAAGLVAEAAPWIVEACRTLIDAKLPDKAIGPLRSLLLANPAQREARSLLTAARNRSARGKRQRRNSMVGFAALLVLALVALVQVRLDQDYERRLEEITDYKDRPALALRMLDAGFADDRSERVETLRAALVERLRTEEGARRDEWLERYRECQLECTLGDPLLSFRRALDLPEPPELTQVREPWPPIGDLLQGIAARLEQAAAELGPPGDDSSDRLHGEQRLARLTRDLLALAAERESSGLLENFQVRLRSVEESLVQRDETRAAERQKRLERERVELQDMLLAAARAHAQAGDLERSVQTFHRLVRMEGSEKLAQLLAREIAAVEGHHAAVILAREMATSGNHAGARAALEDACPNPGEHLLPWRVETRPGGARARLKDGSVRVTPFVLDSTIGERVELVLELPGHGPETLAIDSPADQTVLMSRNPERWWAGEARVEAMPVSVEEDYIVASRAGDVARLTRDGRTLWQIRLDTLGGIARAPVFLPRRPGVLLCLSEDGAVWLIDAASGRIEGPASLGSPPVDGPVPTATGATARFLDGRTAVWETRLKPESCEVPPGGAIEPRNELSQGSNAGLAVLRRRTGLGRTLASPWGPLSVEVGERHYTVRRAGSAEALFTVKRSGEWMFVAWEAPNSKSPGGRLWVSDAAGLRGFRTD
jgi:hypothetical protein